MHWLTVKNRLRQDNSLYAALDVYIKEAQLRADELVGLLQTYEGGYDRVRSLWHRLDGNHDERLLSVVQKCAEELHNNGLVVPIMPIRPPDLSAQDANQFDMHLDRIMDLLHKCLIRRYLRRMSHLMYQAGNKDNEPGDNEENGKSTENRDSSTNQVNTLLWK